VHSIAELKVPPLRCYGIGEQHRAVLVEKAGQASSMKGNPIPLTSEELQEILARAL
jgi:alcohol dehydrogenase class IV